MLLAIDTSTRAIGIALYDGNRVLCENTWISKNHYTIELAPSVDQALAHVGASYEALKELDARLGSELEEWVRKNPGVRQMLRTAKSSGKPVHELLRDFKEMLEKEDEKDK